MSDFISDEEMRELDLAGKSDVVNLQEDTSEDFISDDEMEHLHQSGIASDPHKIKSKHHQGFLDGPLMDGLRQGITLGYAPQVEAAISYPIGKFVEWQTGQDDLVDPYIERRDAALQRMKSHAEENPYQYYGGMVGGGLLGALAGNAMLAGGAKGVQATTAMGRMGQAGKTGAILGGLANPGDTEGEIDALQFGDRARNSLLGAGTGVLLQGGAEFASKGVQAGKRGLKAVGKFLGENKPKENIDEIVEAARKLGIEPTPGMLSDSPVVQGLESSLEQSPTIAGSLVRGKTTPAREGLKKAVQDIADGSTSLSPFEVGERVKAGVIGKVGERNATAGVLFEELRDAYQGMNLPDKSKQAMMRSIRNIKEVKAAPNATFSKKAMQIADDLGNMETVDDLVFNRRLVGKELSKARKNMDQNEASVLGQIYDKLTGLEERSIKRGVIESTRGVKKGSVGANARANLEAKRLLQGLREGKSQYKDLMGDISDFSKRAKIRRSNTPKQFMDVLEDVPSEALVKKMSNANDVASMKRFGEMYPDEMELVKARKLADFLDRADTKHGPSPRKFLNATKSLGKEAKEMFFGAENNIDELRTMIDAVPDRMGPSGTPQGMAFQSFNPWEQLKGAANYGQYKTLSSDKAMRLAERLRNVNVDTTFQNNTPIEAMLRTGYSASGLNKFKDNPIMKNRKLFDMISENPDLIEHIQDEKLKEQLQQYADGRQDFIKREVDSEDARKQYLEGN